jgi:hypothetical protein
MLGPVKDGYDVIGQWLLCAAFLLLAAASITGIWRADSNEWRALAVLMSLFSAAMSLTCLDVALEVTRIWQNQRRGRP